VGTSGHGWVQNLKCPLFRNKSLWHKEIFLSSKSGMAFQGGRHPPPAMVNVAVVQFAAEKMLSCASGRSGRICKQSLQTSWTLQRDPGADAFCKLVCRYLVGGVRGRMPSANLLADTWRVVRGALGIEGVKPLGLQCKAPKPLGGAP